MRESALKRIALGVLLLAAAGCGRNRFDYIDIAASEKALTALEAGFAAVPDSISGGKTAFLLEQGLPVADVLVYRGETGDCLFPDPAVPFGYSCETIGTEVRSIIPIPDLLTTTWRSVPSGPGKESGMSGWTHRPSA